MTDETAIGGTRLRRAPRPRSLQLGGTRVTYAPDGVVQLSPRGWLPDSTEEFWAAHPEYLDGQGYLVGGLGGLLVERDGKALLIDAGFGPRSMPAQPGAPIGAIRGGTLLDSLAVLGQRPGDLDAVAFTHLHPDHLGWATHPVPGGDRLAFSGVDHLVAEPEWRQRGLLEDAGTAKETTEVMAPYVRTVADGEEVFPGVRARFSAGHTPGHTTYVIEGGDGRRLIAFGDVMHSPVQTAHPEWGAAADHDRSQSAASRHALVAELRRPDTIGFGIHFADVPYGRVTEDGNWQPVDREPN